MASRGPGYPPAPVRKSSPSATSIGSAHTANILKNFRQEDIVYALMTQLREKEAEINMLTDQSRGGSRQQLITEQSNFQMKSRIDLHNKAMAEKDTKIAVLEQKLALERKGNGSAIAEAKLSHFTETNTEYKRVLQERDNELSQLRPLLKELKEKVDEFEGKASLKHSERLEEELTQIKGELAIVKDKHFTSNRTNEELEKKIKGKEWMIKSLQEESEEQRSRENHLLTHIKQLNEKIGTYEAKFKGRGIDVPMLLAKLKDYEVRTKDLQGQVRRLTNKKLNELVVRSSPVPHQVEDTKTLDQILTELQSKPKQEVPKEEEDNESEVGENLSEGTDSFVVNSEQDDMEEEATFASNGTDDAKSAQDEDVFAQDEDVLSDFISDVKVGIQTLEMGSLCCAHRPSPVPMTSPPTRYGGSTTNDYHRDHSSSTGYHRGQPSPSASCSSSHTFESQQYNSWKK